MKLYRMEQAPSRVREIAWKAQTRLTARYRALSGRGKKTTVVCTAIARELVGFMWAVVERGECSQAVAGGVPNRARAEAGPRQGKSRQTLCGRLMPTPAVR